MRQNMAAGTVQNDLYHGIYKNIKNLLTYGDTKVIIYVSPKGRRFLYLSPRTGRPTNDPKTHETRIRMSDKEVGKLEYCCEKTGMSKADVIRRGIELVYKEVSEK